MSTGLSRIGESVLEKKFTRHNAENSISEDMVVRIHMKRRALVQGTSWTPSVAEFFMELYPDFIESGFLLSDMPDLYEEDDET